MRRTRLNHFYCYYLKTVCWLASKDKGNKKTDIDSSMMVSSTSVVENGDIAPAIKAPDDHLGVPSGNYRLVGWDMDATGRRFIDEICQIAIYTPDSEYSQYVMPFSDLSPTAKKRHHLKVMNAGCYRVLKNSFTNKVLKTKSAISALTDFLGWLESVKGDATDGIILVHHEPRRVNPSMLIEALTKYNLLDRFKTIVKGFANGFDIAKAKCTNTIKVFSLRTLSRVFLEKDEELSSATHRARLALQIVEHLSSVDEENGRVDEEIGSGDSEQKITKGVVEFIREFVQTVEAAEKECAEHKLVLERQNSLRPIFVPLLNSMGRRERQHASPLRRLLAESAIDYVQLQEAWANNRKEGLENLIEKKVTSGKKDIDDLIEILEYHFDPDKKPSRPNEEEKKNVDKVTSEKKKKKKKRSSNNNNLSGAESPDTTSYSPEKLKVEAEQVVPSREAQLSESSESLI